MRPYRSPSWAADYEEQQAAALLRRERAINEVIERRNPHLKPTAEYMRSKRSSFDPRFNSRADVLRYEARREMAKFDPNVRVDRCSRPPAARRGSALNRRWVR